MAAGAAVIGTLLLPAPPGPAESLRAALRSLGSGARARGESNFRVLGLTFLVLLLTVPLGFRDGEIEEYSAPIVTESFALAQDISGSTPEGVFQGESRRVGESEGKAIGDRNRLKSWDAFSAERRGELLM